MRADFEMIVQKPPILKPTRWRHRCREPYTCDDGGRLTSCSHRFSQDPDPEIPVTCPGVDAKEQSTTPPKAVMLRPQLHKDRVGPSSHFLSLTLPIACLGTLLEPGLAAPCLLPAATLLHVEPKL